MRAGDLVIRIGALVNATYSARAPARVAPGARRPTTNTEVVAFHPPRIGNQKSTPAGYASPGGATPTIVYVHLVAGSTTCLPMTLESPPNCLRHASYASTILRRACRRRLRVVQTGFFIVAMEETSEAAAVRRGRRRSSRSPCLASWRTCDRRWWTEPSRRPSAPRPRTRWACETSGGAAPTTAGPERVRSGRTVRPHHDDPVLIAHGQRLHEHRTKDGEHCRRCADADREDHHGRREEPGRASEAAHGEPDIGTHVVEPPASHTPCPRAPPLRCADAFWHWVPLVSVRLSFLGRTTIVRSSIIYQQGLTLGTQERIVHRIPQTNWTHGSGRWRRSWWRPGMRERREWSWWSGPYRRQR
jgi:hypothetical protein